MLLVIFDCFIIIFGKNFRIYLHVEAFFMSVVGLILVEAFFMAVL